MRESLTVVAAFLILCLSIALAAPYFVDWNAQRGFFEAKLSKALGQKVSIHGDLDLKLLPTPYLHLQKIEITDEAAAARLSADDVFLEIAIPPLLRGDVDLIEARVQRPHLKLHQDADGTLGVPQLDNFSEQARFERILIEDGEIEIDDPAQSRSLVLEHLELSAEANSLSGPFKGDGSSSIFGEKAVFRFSTSERENDHLSVKLIVDKSETHPRADFDGVLSFERRAKNRIAPSFKGNAGFSGLWRSTGDKTDMPPMPWQVSGPLHIVGRKAGMDTLDLRLGDEDHAINTTGMAELDFSGTPKASARLRARQVDLDRFSADPSQTQTPEVREQSLTAALNEMASARFPIPLSIEATAETATLNDETLFDLSGALALSNEPPLKLRFEGNLPGRSHLRLDGHLEPGAAMKFDGHVDASTSELDRMTNWLAGLLPHEADALRKPGFQTVEIGGELSLSRVGFSGRDLNIHLDRSMFAGDLSYTQAVGSEPARFFADMNSPSLDLSGWPNLQDAAQLTNATDLSIRFEAHTIKVTGLSKGAVDTGEIRVKLNKVAGKTTLEDLTLTRPGGADVSAQGVWTGQAGTLDARLNLPKLADTADLLQHLVSDDILGLINQRAAVLSPTQMDLHAEAMAGSSSVPAITALTLSGTTGATSIKANVKSDPKTPANSTVFVTIDAPDSGALLRQLGAPVLPLGGLGRGHVEIKTQGFLNGTPDTMVRASIAGLNVNFHGRVETPSSTGIASFGAAGPLTLKSADVSPVLQAAGLAYPDLASRLPADLSADLDWRASRFDGRNLRGSFAGTALSGFLTYAPQDSAKKLSGSLDLDKVSAASILELALGPPQPAKSGFLWSNLSFGAGLPDPPSASLTLHTKTIEILPGLSGERAATQLEITPGGFTFRDFTMETGGGTAAGTITLRRDGPAAAMAGHLAVKDYGLNLPSLQGHVSATFDISGSGPNALALMSSLAGSGHASFGDFTVRKADPNALERVFTDVEHDRLTIDQSEIERALGREFDRGPLNAGARPFDLAIAAGVLRLTSAAAGPETKDNSAAIGDLSLSLDLRTAAIAQKLDLALMSLPKDWQGAAPRLALEFKGPLTNPVRTIESANFVNTLAARAIAREAARIQAYEFDLHERAFFNQRLQSDRRHDEEQRKAEEEARQAAEAARKAEDALEKLRKAEDARKEEMRKKSEEQARTNPAPDSPPAIHVKPSSSNALQSQQPGTATDPSTAGRY